ncbi:MAG: hypothetical protein Q9162_000316 [Coniocarpon cinnabarinum]
MGSRSIFTIDPENLRTVFSTNFAHWGVESIRLRPMEPFCGRGFLTVDGERWQHSRKVFQPSFDRKAMADFSDLEVYLQKMMQSIPDDNSTVDMQPLLSSLYLDTTTLFLFGESFGQLSGVDAYGDVSRAFDEAMFGCGKRIALGPLGFLARSKKWLNACQKTRLFADKYVEKALSYRDSVTKPSTKAEKNVLLYSMAKQLDDKEQLRNSVLQAFQVAQSTTSLLVENVLWLASKHSGVWQTLRKEVLEQIPDSALPTYDQLQRMSQLRKVITEGERNRNHWNH